MASDLTGEEMVVPTPATSPATEPLGHEARTPHRARLLFIYGLLGGVLALAIVGVVVYASRSTSAAPAWSSWRPHGGGLGAVEDVASHVAPTYKLPNGNQLVDVLTSTPAITPDGKHTVPLQYIAVRRSGGDLDYAITSSNSVEFQMCGLGPACSIATGTPSVARGNLVRREILELALYTFKYVPGMQHVLAVMPPKAGATGSALIYIQRSDLSGLLDKPLGDTLGQKTPFPNSIPPKEAAAISAATAPHTFTAGVASTPQGGLVLVLKKLTA